MSGGQEILGHVVRLTPLTATVLSLDQDTHTTSSPTGLDIAPPVPHHDTTRQSDAPALGSLQQKSRLGLAALALVGIVVVTGKHLLNRQHALYPRVDSFNALMTLEATRHIRLIGHHSKQIARGPEHLARFADAGKQYTL